MTTCEHIPVLKQEVIFYLNCQPRGLYVDGTVGCGGHAKEILNATTPAGFLLGLDLDEEALKRARLTLAPYKNRFCLIEANYKNMLQILREIQIPGFETKPLKAQGILLDLGISSLHLVPERGFSFLHNGPLDMRMNRKNSLTAKIIVNRWSQGRIKEIIQKYGEERWAGKIAKKIAQVRTKEEIHSTQRLAEIVAQAIPRRNWPRHIHPATKTFQALRIVVNQELENLEAFLSSALDCLECLGRLVIISFHSLEDRLVKRTFRNWAKEGKVRILTKKPICPSEQEIKENSKARSAKLRAIEKIC